jgi:hypothetical protein
MDLYGFEVSKERVLEGLAIGTKDCPREAFIDFVRGAEATRLAYAGQPQIVQSQIKRPNHNEWPQHDNPGVNPKIEPPKPKREQFNPHSGSAPRFNPPKYTPDAAMALKNADPATIHRCLYHNSYIWLNNRQHFWFFPTFIGHSSIAGYRWTNDDWVYMGFDLNMIDCFYCSGQ